MKFNFILFNHLATTTTTKNNRIAVCYVNDVQKGQMFAIQCSGFAVRNFFSPDIFFLKFKCNFIKKENF